MTPYLTCEAAAELLAAFVDGELAMAEQVSVESHLRWCGVCESRVADMQLIGASMRCVAQAIPPAAADERALNVIQSGVLARIRAERDQSLGTQFRGLFVDLRLLWPALGATAAVITCLFAAGGVFAAATTEDRPDSMAAMIEMLANPGSDQNPMSLDSRLSAPRALDAGIALDLADEGDAVYALSAVVTREGRVSNYELLMSERASVRRREKAAEGDHHAAALLAAVKRSRFEPAQTPAGGAVAVNVVWLLTRTTVRASSPIELRHVPVSPARVRPRDKAPDELPATPVVDEAPSPTA